MCPQPVIYELMNTGVIGADMRFGEHPEPVGGSIIGRSEDLPWPRLAWLAWR
uniref:LOX6 n=1 Tax=Arundo donax TaxID=35708 RepID=A0A0A9DZ79_ARUDO